MFSLIYFLQLASVTTYWQYRKMVCLEL